MAGESIEVRVMRNIAWEEAKGKLEAIKTTYYDNPNFQRFTELADEFINTVELHGIQE